MSGHGYLWKRTGPTMGTHVRYIVEHVYLSYRYGCRTQFRSVPKKNTMKIYTIYGNDFSRSFQSAISFPKYLWDDSKRKLRLMPRRTASARSSIVGARPNVKYMQHAAQRCEARSNRKPPSSIEEAITVIGDAMRDQRTEYDFVPAAQINSAQDCKRSEAYKVLKYLWEKNTLVCAGYLIWNYAFTDSWPFEKEMRH